MGGQPEGPRARTTTHFLPKFKNASEGARVTEVDVGLMCVSKKHSGSLVMAPPFYAKNSSGNAFSRLAALLLRDHFFAVFGDEGDAAFARWWADAERAALSYSFECVAPRALGDHGATPAGAYVVLTAIARDGSLLAPARVLRLATRWRLPLVEALFVPSRAAAAVEDELRKGRWTMANADADALFARAAQTSGAVEQRFLRHEDVQGPVLEGFVVFEVRSAGAEALRALEALAGAYTEALAPHAQRALESALAWGARCASDPDGVVAALEGPAWRAFGASPGSPRPFAFPEPTPLDVDDDTAWDFACADHGSPPLRRLFATLRRSYGRCAKLKRYAYEGRVQVQVHVTRDEVFYGWPAHVACGAAPLFRGMVVTFGRALGGGGGRPLDAIAPLDPDDGGDDDDAATIGTIVKLKCLRYLVRTFAVRNRLKSLLDGPGTGAGRPEKTAERFVRNWRVPDPYAGAVALLCEEWERHVAGLGASDREGLRRGSYLKVLEPFLDGREPRGLGLFGGGVFGSPDHVTSPPPPPQRSALDPFFVVVCDLTYDGVEAKSLPRALRSLRSAAAKPTSPEPGRVFVCRQPPPRRLLGPATIVACFGPPRGVCASPRTRNRHEGMFERVLDLEGACAAVLVDPKSDDDVQASVAAIGAPAGGAAAPWTARRTRRVVRVIATLAVPPGGGKSTLLAAVKARLGDDATLVSSDASRRAAAATPGSRAHRAEFEKRLRRAFSGPPGTILYDKNIPDEAALARACKDLLAAAKAEGRDDDVVVSLVAPSTLRRDLCWDRVKARGSDDVALNVHESPSAERILDDLFAARCARTLATLDDDDDAPLWARAVLRSDAFWTGADGADATATEFAAEVLDVAPTRALDLLEALEETETRPGSSAASWLAVDVDGTELHVTLVPPTAPRRELAGRLRYAGTRCVVSLGDYHIATRPDVGTVAFWQVERIDGLDDDARYGPQAAIYHLTDLAALDGAARPRHARDAMAQIRGLAEPGPADTAWTIETTPSPSPSRGGRPELAGVVAVR